MNIRPTDTFDKQAKKLKKKYRRIQEDIKEFIEDLMTGRAKCDKIQGLKQEVYKCRCSSRDMQRGKSGGFRIIYCQQPDEIIFLTIYAKTQKDDISNKEIRDLLREIGLT